MKVKILKQTADELKFEIEGEGHTFCNLLQKVLLEDENVEMAGYNIPHPLVSKPVVYIKTKGGKSPREALFEAIEKIKSRQIEFKQAFEFAIKK